MTKEEKKALKAEKALKLMPKWVRTLLLWAGVLCFALAVVFTVLAATNATKANLSSPDFTKLDDSGFVKFVVMAIVAAVLGVCLFAAHIILPKAVFKKKVSIGNTVFAAILMLATIFAGTLSQVAYTGPINEYYESASMTFVGGQKSWRVQAKHVSKHLKAAPDGETELTKFLDANEALAGIASGTESTSDEAYARSFSAHPHKAYDLSSNHDVICDFYLGSLDVSSLEGKLESYTMPSDKAALENQEIWVTYGGSQIFSNKDGMYYSQYSDITPSFDKYAVFGSAVCFLDSTNHAMRIIFSSKFSSK